jgi:hypothetical protein
MVTGKGASGFDVEMVYLPLVGSTGNPLFGQRQRAGGRAIAYGISTAK